MLMAPGMCPCVKSAAERTSTMVSFAPCASCAFKPATVRAPALQAPSHHSASQAGPRMSCIVFQRIILLGGWNKLIHGAGHADHEHRHIGYGKVLANQTDRKSTRLNSSHLGISYAV